MIPKVIHYCWFGGKPLPESTRRYIESWKKFCPDFTIKEWNESNFDIRCNYFISEAYDAKKWAFVADVARMYILVNNGGVYFDTDVEVFKPFDGLLEWDAFAGFEGSKHVPVGTCVMASVANGAWVSEQLGHYQDRHFILSDGSFDMTTNVQKMRENGFAQNGKEQDYMDLHIFPTEYFCPRQTTGEYLRTENTYCDHLGLGSWADQGGGWKARIGEIVGPKSMIRLIKLKRKLLG